jgi:endonuclease III
MIEPTFYRSLLDWYEKNGRHDLPWRQYDEDVTLRSYHVYLAEILLQQTQVSRVCEYYTRILTDFPKIEDLSNTDWEQFYPYYDGLGYYRRGKNILLAAKKVCSEFDGTFPNDYTKLISLPWVGDYTARAIQSFAYDESMLAWDTNVEKIMRRILNGSQYIPLGPWIREQIEEEFAQMGFSGRAINNALMDYGSSANKKNYQTLETEWLLLKYGQFEESLWTTEIAPIREKFTFPTKDAVIRAILHKDHKLYYVNPENDEIFFSIPPLALSWDTDHRSALKKYFLNTYQLSVSVRPFMQSIFWMMHRLSKPMFKCRVGRSVFESRTKDISDFSVKKA